MVKRPIISIISQQVCVAGDTLYAQPSAHASSPAPSCPAPSLTPLLPLLPESDPSQLFNFENGVSLYVHHFPQLAGTRFGDLAYLFPDGLVMGMVDRRTGTTRWVRHRQVVSC
jgi:hypothetical protein